MDEYNIHERRLELHSILKTIMGGTGSHVYFQPPPKMTIPYPAIIYERSRVRKLKANNRNYNKKVVYQVTVISKDPENIFCDKIDDLPYSTYDRRFISDNLYHDVFTVYY